MSEAQHKRNLVQLHVEQWIERSNHFAAQWLRKHCTKETRYAYMRKATTCYVFKKKLDKDGDELYLAVSPGRTFVYVSDGTCSSVRQEFVCNVERHDGIIGAVHFMRGVLAVYRVLN